MCLYLSCLADAAATAVDAQAPTCDAARPQALDVLQAAAAYFAAQQQVPPPAGASKLYEGLDKLAR